MTTQIDWHEELDSSFGSGADRPPADYLVPARAALRDASQAPAEEPTLEAALTRRRAQPRQASL